MKVAGRQSKQRFYNELFSHLREKSTKLYKENTYHIGTMRTSHSEQGINDTYQNTKKSYDKNSKYIKKAISKKTF